MKLAYAVSASPTRFAAVAQGLPLPEAIRYLAGLGYAGVELAIRDPAQVNVEEIAACAHDAGVSIPAIGTGQAFVEEGLALSSSDEGVRARALARLEAQLVPARRLGALLIIGLIHGPIPADADRGQAMDWLLAGLARLSRRARELGVRIVIEPVNRYESNWLNSVGEVMDLIRRLGVDNVGVLPDTFHMNIEERDIGDAIAEARPRLWHMHVADSNRRAPGAGHIQFGDIMARVRAIGYRETVSAEILPLPSFEAAAAQTVAAMRPFVGSGKDPPTPLDR
jgi:5-keto-L-gluconate epimerase